MCLQDPGSDVPGHSPGCSLRRAGRAENPSARTLGAGLPQLPAAVGHPYPSLSDTHAHILPRPRPVQRPEFDNPFAPPWTLRTPPSPSRAPTQSPRGAQARRVRGRGPLCFPIQLRSGPVHRELGLAVAGGAPRWPLAACARRRPSLAHGAQAQRARGEDAVTESSRVCSSPFQSICGPNEAASG